MERQLKIIVHLLARILANQLRIYDEKVILDEIEVAFPPSKSAKKRQGFRPPTLEELKEYMRQKKLSSFDPQEFIDFYESKGWMIGKNKMTSWKSAAGRWERNNQNRNERDRTNTRQLGKGDYYGEPTL